MTTAALVERFASIQGEGRNAGRRALFIRFAGCNLDCHFADGSVCDTPWQHANLKCSVSELVAWCYSMTNGSLAMPLVIITGGEPTMSPAFDDLVRALQRAGFPVAVETNGTLWRKTLAHVDWLVVSPKGGVQHDNPLGAPDLAAEVMALPPDELRVVVGADSPEPTFYPAHTHYLSPAVLSDGSGGEHLGSFPGFAPGAVERCMAIMERNPKWRLSLQLHKFVGAL